MARLPRLDVPGIPQHVMVRGNNKSIMFFGDADRCLFLRYLEEGMKKTGCDLHAFVLMSNHVHLLITGNQPGSLSRLVQAVGRRYSRYINKAYRRTGTLFEGRFRSSLVDSETYFFVCSRYIELNPVRAGMVRAPGEYAWSSYRQNCQGRPAWMLSPHRRYLALGHDQESRGKAYRALFSLPISEEQLEAIRHAARKGTALGPSSFEKELEALLGRKVNSAEPGRPRSNRNVPRSPEVGRSDLTLFGASSEK